MNRRLGIKDYTLKHLKSYTERYRSGVNKTKETIVSSILGDVKGKKILDVGCGCGVFSNHCYKQGAKVFSIDFSANEMGHFLRKAHFRILAYGTFSNVPLFNVADKLMSMFFRGPFKKYKWNRVYFCVKRKEDLNGRKSQCNGGKLGLPYNS